MQKLELLRQKIEEIDTNIVEKLAERQAIVQQIGHLKAQNGMPVVDVNRERQLIDFHVKLSQQYQLRPEFVSSIFALILEYSKELQVGSLCPITSKFSNQ